MTQFEQTSVNTDRILHEHNLLLELIEISPLPFAAYDENDVLIAWNPAYERLHGISFQDEGDQQPGRRFTYEEVIRRSASKSLSGEALEAHIAERIRQQRAASTSSSIREYECAGWHKVHKYLTKSGAVGGFAVDINELKQHERELEEARKAAEAADRTKSEFLANMSHEIRTPMNGVMGMAELLAKTELDPKQKMFTDVIVKSGASLLTIINDILDFSKIDAGQMELDPAPFNLAEAIEDVATLVSSKVAEKDLELVVRIDPDLPKVLIGDVGRIRQIVTNMMGNAVKFTERGHVFVNASGGVNGTGADQSVQLRLSVEDTGIGIPREKLDRVFEKFSQVDTSATRKHEGTGLGLAIASSLVRLMGGQIKAESKVGQGSTFWFETILPVCQTVPQADGSALDVSGSRVLVVDDNNVNRSILSEQMKSCGFDSAACVGGEEALAFLRAAADHAIRVDCVILDYQMPEMSGASVVRTMRSDPKLADIPVIMLTSVTETEDGSSFASLGVQGHLTKPARSSMLLEMLIGVMQRDQANRAGIPPSPDIATNAPQALSRGKEATTAGQDVMEEVSSQPEKRENVIDILVCEDNEVNQIVFTQILQTTGFSFRIASNGNEGISMYRNLQPSIILMDVSMPQMNGLDATMAIREIEAGSDTHVPIIGVTAHAVKGDKERCLEAGMDDYISKPISPDKLSDKIGNWMSRPEHKAVC